MTTEPNPYAPPTSGAAPGAVGRSLGTPLQEFAVTNVQSVPWTLALYPAHLQLAPVGDQQEQGRATFDRQGFIDRTTFNFLSKARAQLRMTKVAPALVLVLPLEVVVAVRTWLGPALREHMAKALRAQRPFAVVFGVLWMLPVARQVHPISIAFGATWLAFAAAATWWPRRPLFLLHAALWTGAAGWIVWGVAFGKSSPYFLIVLIFYWFAVAAGFRSYRFYAPMAAESR
jgi:hypothetical protein